MKLFTKVKFGTIGVLVTAMIMLFTLSINKKVYAQPGYSITFQTFYDDLAPYGNWFNDPQFGYVWAPRVDAGFRPYYTDGYWVNTNYGNMWMSNYAWGWAAFHYGRWAYSDYYGWIWVPGYEWGPAWVSWRQGGGYYGWAPLAPGININISFGSSYYVPYNYWTFIPYGNLYSQRFHRFYMPNRTTVIYNNTTIINNTYVNNRTTYVTGPRRNEVQRVTGTAPRTYQVGTSNQPRRNTVTGDRVNVYNPGVNRQSANGTVTAKPRTVQQTDGRRVITNVNDRGISGRGTDNGTVNRNANNNNGRAAIERNTNDRATTAPTVRNANPNQRVEVEPKNATINRNTQQTTIQRNNNQAVAPTLRSTDVDRNVSPRVENRNTSTPATRTMDNNRSVTPVTRSTTTAPSVQNRDASNTRVQQGSSIQRSTTPARRSTTPARSSNSGSANNSRSTERTPRR